MSEEMPRRYVTIRRRYDGKRSGPISAVVWDSVPGRDGETQLTHVRPVVRLTGKEVGRVYGLIGAVHAALEGAGPLGRARRFVGQAYYLGSYDEVLALAKEYVEVRQTARVFQPSRPALDMREFDAKHDVPATFAGWGSGGSDVGVGVGIGIA